MSKHRVTAQRGPTITIRLREDAHAKFQELTEYRFNMNLNSNKGDIMSQAIEELFERELGQFKKKAQS